MTTQGEAAAPRLSDADMAQLLGLLKSVDSVELKVTVPVTQHRTTIRGLPLDPVEAIPRQVFFFDTPDLALDHAGVVVRARRIQGGRGDTVVKLRPVQPEHLTPELRRNASFNVEVDVLPGGLACSGSFKGRSTGEDVNQAVAGDLPLAKLFSKDQRAFYAQHAPHGIELDALRVLGPTFVLKSVFAADMAAFGSTPQRRMVAEMWLYPDGSRILELSLKCLPAEAFQVAMEARAYLAAHGVSLGGSQQTKTRAALSYFSAELEREAAGTTE
jgi:hypothetical protein